MKRILIGIFAILSIASATTPVAQAAPASPHTFIAQACPGRFLTLPAWYRGLPGDTSCKPTISKIEQIWVIGLNIIEMMMHIVVYVASGFTIWAGFRYMTANGEPDKITAAKNTITQALVGVGISVMAIAMINFIVDAAS